ncbi:unnamed protein product [Paramecium sonneborni]|uniref:Uncharacterized protein n=1 Tax=Paramecium sonneborni TaxID=65129 RepID=A0A8S1RMU2_9CILI|nr:unnamed protein product [Paramecium sonneborni]
MKLIQYLVERESDNIRKMSHLALIKKVQKRQQTETIELQFNKLKLLEPTLKVELQNLGKFCKNLKNFEFIMEITFIQMITLFVSYLLDSDVLLVVIKVQLCQKLLMDQNINFHPYFQRKSKNSNWMIYIDCFVT